ncbi:MAG TPA: hypothetical protein VFE08_14955 [Candidatus Sulfotelmatobacter sp.]|jgi:hypothetical protein|nr:hypothetical protein [Candidatus Sulfotelmatobacter sp.]
MQLSRVLKISAVLLAALSIFPNSGLAKDGRDFAGFYNVSNVVEQGDQLVLTLQVRLFNYSDTDLKQAVVTLRSSHPAPVLAQFRPVRLWRNRTEVKLTQQIVIPRHEVELWKRGTQPALFVVYYDANGQRWERFAQVSSRPGTAR